MLKPLASCLSVLILTVVVAHPAWSQGAGRGGPSPEQVQMRLEQAAKRLNLTPEQEEALRPLMEERARKMKAIHAKHAGNTTGKGRRAMMKEMRPVQQQYEADVREILDDEQEAEWEAMRAEMRKQMRERQRSGWATE